MSNQTRALVIGMLGPAIAGFGFLSALLKALLTSNPDQATFRYLLFDSPHLVMAVGIVVAFITLPIAIQVALATPEETEIPVFEVEEEPEPEFEPEPAHAEHAGRYGWSSE
jgi:hypothetical protein